MYLNLFIISVFLVAVIMLALGVKLLFDRNARFEAHSCGIEAGDVDEFGACAKCQIKDLANCPEKKDT